MEVGASPKRCSEGSIPSSLAIFFNRGVVQPGVDVISMPFKDPEKRKQYHVGYWKEYYSDPVRKEKHRQAVHKSEKKRLLLLHAAVKEYKLTAGCRNCGYNEHHAALDFAHKNRANKIDNIGTMLRRRGASKRVWAEIVKCDVLCANCHRVETFQEIIGARVQIPSP